MKSKCSFILRASTALVLCFLMLFGTVTTSLTAVVENADTGAKADLAGTGYTFTFKGGQIYFDATRTAVESHASKYIYLGASNNDNTWYKPLVKMTRISNTGIYYATVGSTWSLDNNPNFGVIVTTASKTIENWADSDIYAIYYMGSNWEFNSNDNYLMYAEDAANNNSSLTTGAAGMSNGSEAYNQTLNTNTNYYKAQGVIAQYKAVGATSYTKGTTGGTGKASGYKWNNGTSVTTDTATTTGTTEQTFYGARTTTVTLTNTPVNGYSFDGWFTTESGSTTRSTSYTVGDSDVTSYARFSENANTVTFQKKLGSSAAATITTKSAGVTTKASYTAPDESGYTFTGWTITSGSANASNVTGTGSASDTTVSLNAKGAVTVTANYEASGTCGFDLSSSSAAIDIGSTATFTATPNAYHKSGTITAASSNTGVATVSKSDNSYTVTGVSHGTAKITVSCSEGGSAEFNVTVNTPTVSLSAGSTSLYLGETTTITPAVTHQGTASVSYSNTDSTVASLTGTTVKALKAGSTKITATVDGVTSSEVTITVNDPTVSADNITGKKVNDTGTFSATGTPSGKGTITYALKSGQDTAGLVISGTGYTAKKPGTYTVVATYPYTNNGVSKSVTKEFTVAVAEPSLSFNSLTIEEMKSGDLTATVPSGQPSPTAHQWSESDSNISLVADTVNSQTVKIAVGELSADTTATVTLRATYNDAYHKDFTSTVTLKKSKIYIGSEIAGDWTERKMTYDSDSGFYKYTYTGVTATTAKAYYIHDDTTYYNNAGTAITESTAAARLGGAGITLTTVNGDAQSKITPGANGAYTFYYDATNHKVWVSYPSKNYYLLGFGQDNWTENASTIMTETGTGTNIFTYTKTFTAGSTYEKGSGNQNTGFKVKCNDGSYYGINDNYTETAEKQLSTETDNIGLHASYSGEYTFTFNANTKKLTVTYPNRTVNTATSPASGPAAVTKSYVSGDTFELTAADNAEYVFSTWAALPGGVTLASGYALTDKTIRVVVTTTSAVTVTANFSSRPDPVITYTAMKTDDGSTLTSGGGTITAKEIHYTPGTAGTGTASYLYLWWSGSDNPEQHTNKVDAVKATDGSYYASFQPSGNFFFNITDSSSSATDGNQKITSTTTGEVGDGFADWTTVGNWSSYYIGKGYLNSGDTVYIKYDPSAKDSKGVVYFSNSAFTYTIEYTGGTGGTEATETVVKTLGASPDTITYNNRVKFTATPAEGYAFDGWYSDSSYTTLVSKDKVYTTADLTDDYTIYAKFKEQHYITLYNSYQYTNGKYTFVAAPPRKVEIGSGASMRTYVYNTGEGNQRGEEYVLYDSGTYYEGNKLAVYPGEKVKLYFTSLASSDAIKGIFYNNDRRYTTENEDDNLYYMRRMRNDSGHEGESYGNKTDGYVDGYGLVLGSAENVPDDDWDYTFRSDTTIFADEGYYTNNASTISAQQSNYAANKTGGAVDQSAHTIEWIAEGSYLNIDIQLAYKYQVHINGDDWSGISIENMNDEGYYYHGENFTKTVDSTTKEFKISIEQPTDGSGTYSWTSTDAILSLNSNPSTPQPPSGVAVTAKKSDGTTASTAAEVSYFVVTGEMTNAALYITLPLAKKYKMYMHNTVVSDTIGKRHMITEAFGNGTENYSATDPIGTITAYASSDTSQSTNIATDGKNYFMDTNNGATTLYVGPPSNGYGYQNKIYGGMNLDGAEVLSTDKVTYTFTFNDGKDANYSFVGWFEGTINSDKSVTPNYNKKLSGKTTFTYEPKKDTTVVAVATRDIYIGGSFTAAGAYSTTETTWSGSRILMQYDPTYVNPSDSSKKGRYYYTFNTVTRDALYEFRCYDTKSGTATTDLTVWQNKDSDNYENDYDDVWEQRVTGSPSTGKFKFTAANANNGYGNPVTVYFYAYDGGFSVDSTYQWSKAYVSAGRGVDVVDVSKTEVSEKYNVPTVSVAATTVGGKEVGGYNTTVPYGNEDILACTVKEPNGQLQVTANPNDTHLCVQAFLVYNIDTKASEAVMVNSAEATGAITANITVPQNSKLYIVPIYKFTKTYIEQQNLETHTVYVRAEDMDKDVWGGLVAMYSWGTDSRYDSGGWPGQLMIPSDDGSSFYAPLTFTKNGLAGVTFNNYTQVWNSNFVNFLGLYDSSVSNTQYSSYTGTNTHYINQAYDYREPISIIENINEDSDNDGISDIYDNEDMDLTFALKMGNKNGSHFGETDYDSSYSFEYLTDRSGKSRVDLNGNKLTTNATASYYVVCSYTRDYCTTGGKSYDFKDGSRDGTGTHNVYSIEWTVYDNTTSHTKIGSTKLSAAYTDVYKSEMMTYVAKMLDTYGFPVSGKAVKIAYEDPAEKLKNENNQDTEAKRFSGQWYADGVNSLIEGNVRVGIYSDGAWLPSDTNAPGYATATVGVKSGSGITIPNTATGEAFVQEDGCSGNSLVKVTKKNATNSNITFTVSTDSNFLGWYRDDGNGGFEPVGSNYKSLTITPSFNSDITYYAFYSASASYRVKYKDRYGNDKYFTAKGYDLTPEELADNNQYLDPSKRTADISTALAKASDIRVFNKSYSIALQNPTKTAYTLTYDAVQADSTYTLTAYYYDASGGLTQHGNISGGFNTVIDLTDSDIGGAGKSLVENKPTSDNKYFVGWKRYVPGTGVTGEILSTHANFGYALTEDLTIAPVFSDTKPSIVGTWRSNVDKNVITQELTNATTGVIYNDSIISFRHSADSATQFEGEKGIVILAQANTATAEQKANFTTDDSKNVCSTAKALAYLNALKNKNKTSSKMNSTAYGEAYAFYIEAGDLSRLNRIDIMQKLDYAKFNGGNYVVAAYHKVEGGEYQVDSYVSDTYTTHEYSTITGVRRALAN